MQAPNRSERFAKIKGFSGAFRPVWVFASLALNKFLWVGEPSPWLRALAISICQFREATRQGESIRAGAGAALVETRPTRNVSFNRQSMRLVWRIARVLTDRQ